MENRNSPSGSLSGEANDNSTSSIEPSSIAAECCTLQMESNWVTTTGIDNTNNNINSYWDCTLTSNGVWNAEASTDHVVASTGETPNFGEVPPTPTEELYNILNAYRPESANVSGLAALDGFFAGIANGSISLGSSSIAGEGNALTSVSIPGDAAAVSTSSESIPEMPEVQQPSTAEVGIETTSPSSPNAVSPLFHMLNPGDQPTRAGENVELLRAAR